MKKITETQDLLVLEQTHWRFAALLCLIGLGVLLSPGSGDIQEGDMISGNWAGVIVMFFGSLMFEHSRAEFSRSHNVVRLLIRRLWRSRKTDIPIDDITYIRRSASYGKGGGKTYRIVILCDEKEVPLSMMHTPDGDGWQDRAVQKMRTYCGISG